MHHNTEEFSQNRLTYRFDVLNDEKRVNGVTEKLRKTEKSVE